MINKKLLDYDFNEKINVFSRIIEDLDPKEIPSEFIDYIKIEFHDGSSVIVEGDIVDLPVPFKERNPDERKIKNVLKNVKAMKVVIKEERLQKEVNKKIGKIFKKRKTNS